MYAVIMAGGQGTRLWPLSRQKNPKQLQALVGDKPLILETFSRLLPLVKAEKIFVLTTRELKPKIKKVLPNVSEENYIIEPYPMGTAAACALATAILEARESEAKILFLPSDASVEDEKGFLNCLKFGNKLLDKHLGHIITIGINPTKPDVNLGYIQMDSQIETDGKEKAFSVKRFIEKPDLKRAKQYQASWDYLWNAGMFMWRSNHFLSLVEKNLPKSWKFTQKIAKLKGVELEAFIQNDYKKVEKTTVDYGIMEKTEDILVVPGDFGWSDIGSWGSLLEILTKAKETNIISKGNHLGLNNENCLVMAGEKLIATVGLKGIVVVDTPDVLLICNSNQSHEVKALIEKIKEQGKEEYL